MTAPHPRELWLVAPDLSRPSGGNVYDSRLAEHLARTDRWSVRTSMLPGRWPLADSQATSALARTLAAVPDGGLVLVDGLVAGGAPDVIGPAAQRLRLVVLVHLPLADETGLAPDTAAELADRERQVLRAASAVVVTSRWAAGRLEAAGLRTDQLHVVPPGTDAAPIARGSLWTGGPGELLCVAAVTPRKDQLTLIDALAEVSDLGWRCTCVGPTDAAPDYAAAVRERIAAHGLEQRLRLVGALEDGSLAAAYDAADLLVLVSRTETFGMVITEALARGVPVLTTAGGAAEDTLGTAPDGRIPGLLVPAGDVGATASALRRWLTDGACRERLAAAARTRRQSLGTWDEAARAMSTVLDRLREPAVRW